MWSLLFCLFCRDVIHSLHQPQLTSHELQLQAGRPFGWGVRCQLLSLPLGTRVSQYIVVTKQSGLWSNAWQVAPRCKVVHCHVPDEDVGNQQDVSQLDVTPCSNGNSKANITQARWSGMNSIDTYQALFIRQQEQHKQQRCCFVPIPLSHLTREHVPPSPQ
jgi:hypothetical protein